MSGNIQCVFLPPDFHINDILAISMFVEDTCENIPVLEIEIDDKTIEISQGVQVENKLSWITEAVDEFKDITTETKVFSGKVNDKTFSFDLDKLVYLGPIKTAKPEPNIFLLEFTSGFYCAESDYKNDSVTFNVDSILTLDYRNVSSIKAQLEELSSVQATFEETKNRLTENGIDLEELGKLKNQYEQSMREKRRVQHEFMEQNQRMQAVTIHSQCEQDRQSAVDALRKHIETNKQRAQKPVADMESYNRLVKFRLTALEELKAIFPFDQNNRLCSLPYSQAPANAQQFNDMRAYLGFATHYVREVSRVLGIPLQYILVPFAASSKIISRLSESKQYTIPAEYSQISLKIMKEYEKYLCECIVHINKTLITDNQESSSSLPECIQTLRAIDEKKLATLIPK